MDDSGVEQADGDTDEQVARDPVYALLTMIEALEGLEQLLLRPTGSSATARDELWAAAELVGWLREYVQSPDAALEADLSRGQAALAHAAEHPLEPQRWDDLCRCLTNTRRLLTVTLASLVQ